MIAVGRKCQETVAILAIVAAVAISFVLMVVAEPEFEKRALYNSAMNDFGQQQYADAVVKFGKLDGFQDASEKLVQAEKIMMDVAETGATVFFGSYRQGSDPSDEAEAIEWIVLDESEGSLLLISKYALACLPYSTERGTTWETSPLRRWLNGEFLETAFTNCERTMIGGDFSVPCGNAKNDKAGNLEVSDDVFLLDIQQVRFYFSSDEDRACEPTARAIAEGAYVNAGTLGVGWWLRPPDNPELFAAGVRSDGSVLSYGGDTGRDFLCVRPVLWISNR